MATVNLRLITAPAPPVSGAVDIALEPTIRIGVAGGTPGSETGHTLGSFNGSEGWGRVSLTNPVNAPEDWPDAVTEYTDEGVTLRRLAFSVDNIGGWIRWNHVENPRAIIIAHLGGGGAGGWMDRRGSNGWATFMAANPDVMLVGLRYFEFGGSYNYYIGKARQFRRSAQGTTVRAVGRRVLEALRWIDRELGGSETDLVLAGSSFGVDAVLQPFYRADPMLARVKLFAPISYYPGWDLAAACAEDTPPGTWADTDTGEIGPEGEPFTAGASFRIGTDLGARRVINAIWAISSTSQGCMGGNPSAAQVEGSSGLSQMDLVSELRYTGPVWAFVGTGGSGNDDIMGCTWAQANLLAHEVFSQAQVTWVHSPTLQHGDIWSEDDSARVQLFGAIEGALDESIRPAFIASIAVVYEPSVQPGGVAIQPAFIASAAVTYEPTVQPGAVTVAPSFIAATSTVHAPIVVEGTAGVTVQPAFIAATSEVFGPTVEPGAAVLQPAFIASGAAVFAPTVSEGVPGATTIAPAFIASTATVPEPTIEAGAVTIAPQTIASAATVYVPAVTYGAIRVEPEFIAAASQVFAPEIMFGAVAIEVPFIAGTSEVYGPDIGVAPGPRGRLTATVADSRLTAAVRSSRLTVTVEK